jgi:hypothetical protein
VAGGLGIMPRRTSVDPLFAYSGHDTQNFAMSQPQKLLKLLPSIHPSVGFALSTALRLMFPPGGFTIECYSTDAKPLPLPPFGRKSRRGSIRVGKGRLGSQKANQGRLPLKKMGQPKPHIPDDKATSAIASMFESLPQEIGGLDGMATTLAIQALLTGMVCIEGVPGMLLQGLSRVWPVDSLSITFVRIGRDADLEPYQTQVFPESDPLINGMDLSPEERQIAVILGLRLVHLDKNTFLWRAVDADVDDAYGMAPYATCLNEVIADLALMQDLRDAVHNAAWPRIVAGVNLLELHRVAVEVHRITDPTEASKWVMARFKEVVDYVSDLMADDNVVVDSNGDIKTLQPGSFQGLEGVLAFLRQRIVQSLKTLPTLMGVQDSANFSFTSVEWGIYAAGLESIRSIVCDVIVRMANLHLRLLGKKAKAVAKYTPIRTSDELVSANTENVNLQNAQLHEKMGYKSHDEAGMAATGHKPVGEPVEGMVKPAPQPVPLAGGFGGPRNKANNSVNRTAAGRVGGAKQSKGSRNGGAGSKGSAKRGNERDVQKTLKTVKKV